MVYLDKEPYNEQTDEYFKETLSNLQENVRKSVEDWESLWDEFLSYWKTISTTQRKKIDIRRFTKKEECIVLWTDEIELEGNKCKIIKVMKFSVDHLWQEDTKETSILYNEAKWEFYYSWTGLSRDWTPMDYVMAKSYLDRISKRIKQLKKQNKKIFDDFAKEYVSTGEQWKYDKIDQSYSV